jgi:transposase-like protein
MSRKKQPMTEEQEAFSNITKQIMKLSRRPGGLDGQSFVKELMSKTYQALLDAELSEHLSNPKKNSASEEVEELDLQNSRNGRGRKIIRGDFGEAEINPPRDRAGTFDPVIVPKRSSTVGNFTDKVISLYARGMTTREISAHLEEMYNIELSESFVSRAVATVQSEVKTWQERILDEVYAILYVDGIRFNVRGDNGKVIKKCFYTVLGTNLDGNQEVLGMWIADTEGASFWLTVLDDLKHRGVKDILIACADGLVGLPDAFEASFPNTDFQLCIVHQVRNCTKFVSYKDRKALCADMKKIYNAVNEQGAVEALAELETKWGKQYPQVINSWQQKWSLLIGFLRYPQEIRKITYTTNTIEALHSMFRKNTKNRKVFPNDESLFKLLFLNIKNITKKWTKRQGWNIVIQQLAILFGERVTTHMNKNLEN